MSPDDMADYHAFMAEKFAIRHRDADGLLAAVWQLLSEAENSKYRYWWEKARENG